jgi:hypothetical protein
MVYLAKKDGKVVHHTDPQAMKDLDGIQAPDMTVTDEEFAAADSLARIIGGKIVLGKTDDEKQAEADQARVQEIDKELESLDAASRRPARIVSAALAKKQTAPAKDVQYLEDYETQAQALRTERAELVKETA